MANLASWETVPPPGDTKLDHGFPLEGVTPAGGMAFASVGRAGLAEFKQQVCSLEAAPGKLERTVNSMEPSLLSAVRTVLKEQRPPDRRLAKLYFQEGQVEALTKLHAEAPAPQRALPSVQATTCWTLS